MKVLIVEDERKTAEYLQQGLTEQGCTVEHVGAGREAGAGGAPGHQHFDAVGRVAQQQHGGSGAHRRRRALGMEELGGAYHGWRLSAPPATPAV